MERSPDFSASRAYRVLLNVAFFAMLATLLLVRVLVFMKINLGYVDSDQPFMWIGAHDYAQGHFYEPRFYGQDYNTFMEALFAVPFMWMKLPVYVAVPLATHIIFLTPWLFTAFWLLSNRRKEAALLALFVPLCMPVEYDMLTAIPRGFVTGMFFCSFFITSIYNPRSLKLIALNTVCAVVGYFVNPNSLVASAPVLAFIFLNNYSRPKYYLVTLLCLSAALPLHLLLDRFYKVHPDYIIYGLFYSFTPSHFFRNIGALPGAFVHITPFAPGLPWLLIGALGVLAVILLLRNKIAGISFLVMFAVVIGACLSDKTADGSWWPFYSYSRMFLAVPFVIAVFGSTIVLRARMTLLFVAALAVHLGVKFATFEKRIAYNLQDKLWVGVHLVKMTDVMNTLPFYRDKCKEYGVNDLCISNPFWLSSCIAYGGPSIYPDYPRTQETNSERRYRIREEGKTRFVKSLMYLSCRSDIDKWINTTNFEMVRLDDYGLFYIRNNRLSINDFLKEVKATEDQMH